MPGVQCYYVSNSLTTTNSSFNSVISSLASGIVATSTGAAEGTLSGYTSSGSPVYSGLTSFLSTKDPGAPSGYPKAYLNWILLDDQFNYVSGSSGSVATASTTYPANQMNTVAAGGPVVMTRNGYLYVWVSNETQGWDVFFDNFSVYYKQGPVLEENHYYPFGLTMAGISDKAIKTSYAENKYRYNKGSELQNKEFIDQSGLEWYETHYRMLDPQLGRWNQIDPKCEAAINPAAKENENAEDEAEVGGLESMSPYASMGNDPIHHNDPDGDIFGIDNLIGAVVGAAVEIGTQMVTNALTGQKVTDIKWGHVLVAAGEGLLTDGASNLGKAALRISAAVANSAIDHHKEGFGAVVKGAVVNMAVDKVGGAAGNLTKHIGGKQLNTMAKSMVGSEKKIAKNILANNSMTAKTATTLAKAVKATETSFGNKVIKEAPKNAGEAVGAGAAEAGHEKLEKASSNGQ